MTVVLAPQAASAQGAKTLTLTVPAQSRATANIRALNLGGGAQSVGMLISSDQPIVPERVLYFGDGAGSGKFGSTVSTGIPAPATRLYLAAGQSGGVAGGQAQGDQAYLTVLNPARTGTVQVTAAFADAAGQPVGSPVVLRVAAGTRGTIAVNEVLGVGAVHPFSAVISATGPIAAEVAEYAGGSPNRGRHPGVAFPLLGGGSGTVYLANLQTALPDGTPLAQTVYLYNPGAAAEAVTGTYYGGNGATAQSRYSVPAHGVTVVDVGADAGLTVPPGPLGARFAAEGGGTLMAYAVGTTGDGRSSTEDVGTSAG